ncbi:MAG: SDR family oxidoreductase [Candidatus Eisenbacteria bacterium]|nr:SDR family oxidoreductase [Candidatus Eisenbacteria bacterium]
MVSLKDKVAVVTGSTRGIGRAIAELLLAEGARVMVSARDAAAVDAAVRDLASRGPVAGRACDVRDRAQVEALVADTEERFGGLDILVNNAGVGVFKDVQAMSDDEWDSVMRTNVDGVFFACRAAVPALRRRGGGAIINIGSLAGKQAFAGAAAYCASKHALVGFSEALMLEVRHDHIRVAYVMPGSVETDFGGSGRPAAPWKLSSGDVAEVVVGLLKQNPRALASRVELRPSEPPRK